MLMASCEQVTISFRRKLGSFCRHLRDGGWAMCPHRDKAQDSVQFPAVVWWVRPAWCWGRGG